MAALRPKLRARRPLRCALAGLEEGRVGEGGLLRELLCLGGGEELRRRAEALPRSGDLGVEAGGVVGG